MATLTWQEEMYQQLSDIANRSGMRGGKEILELLSNDHNTIQQNFTRMCVQWFEILAEKEKYIDLRNEASIKLAKEFVSKIENRYLPYV